ncbi:hypothetical protein MHSWG343_04680 [Candidatus Mycoplasma haematohominis]|uniref:Uncharacterized protein n=1 Tax=Candidatus Mycoplasma haematohominis TaxID=1494318 RepID=A0A478FPV9_9MOLU|nr:hypothetical protein MHSWG343_04680 [Candidatus Mycoplasma haemohominis]
MTTVGKGAAIVGASALVIGGSGVGVKFLIDAQEPVWYALSSESGFPNNYEGRVGKEYGNYLVGVYGDKDGQKNRNQKWWEWSYKQFEYDVKNNPSILSSEFFDSATKKSKVSGAYKPSSSTVASESLKELNEACKGVYDKQTSELTDNNLIQDLWKYCSHLGKKPDLLVSGSGYTNGSFGANTSHHNKAVATKGYEKGSSNDEFWRLRNEEFFGTGENSGNIGVTDGIFKKLYEKKEKGEITSEDTVRKTCEKAYERQESAKDTDPKVEDSDIKKFCYLTPTT